MRSAVIFVAALAALVALSAPANAEAVSSVVLLHDLVENGAYAGCHVTSAAFTTYRLNVIEGSTVTLEVQAPANNTNIHFLNVEGVDGRTDRLAAGQSATLTFTAPGPGSRAVLCDDEPGPLQGVMRVQAAPDEKTPGLAVGVALATVAFVAVAYRRRG